jgi:ankyrin repeat protein
MLLLVLSKTYETTFSRVLKNKRLLAWFLAHGASPNAPAATSRTAIDAAARIASAQVVARLLQHGGTIGTTNALHMAIRSPKPGRYEMVECLLEVGAHIDALEHEGTEQLLTRASSELGTALHNAAREGRDDLVRLLLERGANVGIRDTLGRTPAELAEEEGHLGLVSALSISEGDTKIGD